jgi:inosine-uridine nucleoside N-ribohydrolase
MDWNVQCDPQAAFIVSAKADLTLVTLPATLTAHLRASHIPRVRASGRIGELLAIQSEVHARESHMQDLGRRHPALPDDLLNFHYDPVTCAIALGWPGATIQEMLLEPVLRDGTLHFQRGDASHLIRVVTGVDGDEFAELWLTRIEAFRTA